jgi:outer membrane protein
MRKTFSSWAVLVALLVASQAQASASFANRHLGLGVSGFALVGDSTAIGIDWGVPITLEGGFYIENGFEIFLKVPLVIAQQKFGVTANDGPGIVAASGGQFGVRYLFLEESIRPYASLHLAGLYFFRDDRTAGRLNNFFGGPGLGLGVDFFVGESVSIGVRGYTDMFLTFNTPGTGGVSVAFAIGGGAYVTTYF